MSGDPPHDTPAGTLDAWTTLEAEERASLKIQRSEFIGIAFPCTSEDEFGARLAAIQREHFDATHHCWAWRLFNEGDEAHRFSDAGEPNGTAGRPIFGAIESAGLHDVGVVVVRYYGGVKLGTGGLGRAYRDAAREVLANAATCERYLYDLVSAEVPFAQISVPYRLVHPPHVSIAEEHYGDVNVFTFRVRRSRRAQLEEELTQQRFALVP